MAKKTYIEQLRIHRLKVTPKREAIIELLLKKKKYYSPLEVWEQLKKRFHRLGIPTIYRILEEFRHIGIATRIERENMQLYYALCAPGHLHHHFVCRKCKKVIPVEVCFFHDMSVLIEKTLRCRAESHTCQIEGLCSECLKKADE